MRQMERILRMTIRYEALRYRLNIDAFAADIKDVAAEDGILADNRHCGDEFFNRLLVWLAIVVHEPEVRAGEGQRRPHADMKAARAASVLLRTNHVKGCVSTATSAASRSRVGWSGAL